MAEKRGRLARASAKEGAGKYRGGKEAAPEGVSPGAVQLHALGAVSTL